MCTRAGRDKSRYAFAPRLLFIVLWTIGIFSDAAALDIPSPPPAPVSELILQLEMDGEPLPATLIGEEKDGKLALPVCALAAELSIAINCQDRRAYGFVLKESRPLVIDVEAGYAILGREVVPLGTTTTFRDGDLFVDVAVLSRLLPVDFKLDHADSVLHLHPREVLPSQGLRKRQKLIRPPILEPKKLPDVTRETAFVAVPTIDFATQLQLVGEEHTTMKGATLNSLDVSGDFLHMSGEGHLSAENEVLKRLDLSLFRRRDPAFRIGPIPVTQVRLGSSQVPYIDGIGASPKPMYGIYLTNRPVYGSTNFLRHDINGSLPQGWDAELLHNGMPVAYQPPTSDNMYHFQNLQVYYGINNFKVILHGPFGETRESDETFVSDAVTPKGDFLYTISSVFETGVTDNDSDAGAPHRETNTTLTSDFGITKNVTGALSLVRHTDLYGVERDFGMIAVRTAVWDTLLSADLIDEYYPADSGTGGLFTLKWSSRDLLGLSSLEAVQRVFWNYDSPQFPTSTDPLATRTMFRGNSSFTAYGTRIPFSLEVDIDSLKSGEVDETSAFRVSGGWNGWNGALEADLSYQKDVFNAATVFQVSTRVSGISLRGQSTFIFAPDVYASTINLSADKEIGRGLFFNSSISHDPTSNVSEFKAGLSKRYGLVGYSFAGTATTRGAFSLTAGVRTSLGVDPANHQAVVSSEPLSPYGMIAVSAVAPDPGNASGKPVPVGFLVNGGRAVTVTGTGGVPVIVNLQPDIPVDVTVDLSTVEDPFMMPLEDGCRIVPRAGVVAACKFTMTTGGEIDGMILVRLGKTGDVPLKDVRVDLVSEGGKLLGSTRSQESGYYLFKAVKPGNYRVVIPEAELARLRTESVSPIVVAMPAGGDLISGKDFNLVPTAGGKKETGGKEP